MDRGQRALSPGLGEGPFPRLAALSPRSRTESARSQGRRPETHGIRPLAPPGRRAGPLRLSDGTGAPRTRRRPEARKRAALAPEHAGLVLLGRGAAENRRQAGG